MDEEKPTGIPAASKTSAYIGWLVLLLGTVAVLGIAYFIKP